MGRLGRAACGGRLYGLDHAALYFGRGGAAARGLWACFCGLVGAGAALDLAYLAAKLSDFAVNLAPMLHLALHFGALLLLLQHYCFAGLARPEAKMGERL